MWFGNADYSMMDEGRGGFCCVVRCVKERERERERESSKRLRCEMERVLRGRVWIRDKGFNIIYCTVAILLQLLFDNS